MFQSVKLSAVLAVDQCVINVMFGVLGAEMFYVMIVRLYVDAEKVLVEIVSSHALCVGDLCVKNVR